MEQTPKPDAAGASGDSQAKPSDSQAKPNESPANPSVISVNPQGEANPAPPASQPRTLVTPTALSTPSPVSATPSSTGRTVASSPGSAGNSTPTPSPRRYKPIILPEDETHGFDHGHGHPFVLLIRRTLAFFVDTIGIGIVAAMFGYQLMQTGKLPLAQDEQGFTRLFALSLGAALIFLFLFEWIFGTSIGKLIFGLHVRRVSGQRAGLGHTFWRNLFRLIEIILIPVAVIMILVLRHRQRIGDKVSDTTVGRSPIGPFSTITGLLLVGALAWAVAEYAGGASTLQTLRTRAESYGPDLYQRAVTFFTSHSNALPLPPSIRKQPSNAPTPT